jgi:phage shock protein PspC (stress-responsive transcriptional regulator)
LNGAFALQFPTFGIGFPDFPTSLLPLHKKYTLELKRFILYYVLYTALLAGIALSLPYFFPDVKLLANKFWLVFGFLGMLTFIAYIVAFLGMKRNPETGVLAIMGSIAVKMLFSMAFVLIYSLNHKGKDVVFVLNFFSLYLLFTFFEIYGLLCNLRHQNKK